MKKVLSLLLTMVLMLAALPFAAAEDSFIVPKVGDRCSGFVVHDISRLDMLNADVVIYEHEKTGALVMLIENEDTNRTFEITFRTPAINNTGIPHVFEHSTLDGSKKYPSKALWFNTSYQTYNTYMNASTYNFMTTYPIASLSEEQLLKLADFYTDSCFNPMICEDESIFREEAWRYALDSADSDLRIEGIVYSEMCGAYDINFASSLNYNRTLFPGTFAGNNYGGTPADIPDMTWEDIILYHDAYYHPSNSLTCLYGKFENPDAFLELLNGYFSRYEKADIHFGDADYASITAPAESVWEYGLASGTDTQNGSVIDYGFACDGCDEETCLKVDMLTDLIASSSSLLNQKMKDALPYASVMCGMDISGSVPSILFEAKNVNPEDAEIFRKVVDEAMTEALKQGFEPDTVSAVAAAKRISYMLAGESSSVGVDLIPNIALYWACFDDVHGYQKRIGMSDQYVQFSKDGTFSEIIRKYIVENEHRALSVTKPVAGLKDKEDAALAQRLAEIKAGMSDEEIAAIVAYDNTSDEDTDAYLEQLKAVSVQDLPEEVRIYDITDVTGADGVRRIDADANTDGIGAALIMLDAGGFAQQDLHTFKLYTTLLGVLDTSRHTRAQLSALITRYLYNASLRVSLLGEPDGEAAPYLRGSFIAMDEDMQSAYDLLYEIFFETKLDDIPTIKGEISAQKNELRQSISSNPTSMLFYRGYGNVSKSSACFGYISFLDYYQFLCETEKRMETDPELVLDELRRVQRALNTSANAISAFAGSEESAQKHRAVADAFLKRLTKTPVAHQKYDFAPSAKSEAYIIDNAVQFNVRFAPYEAMGLDGYSCELSVLNTILSDAYMLPKLRDQYGAYGAYAAANMQHGEILYTIRDPYIDETAGVFDAIPEAAQSILGTIDQDTLDGYILSTYSDLALSAGELSGGLNAILNMLLGIEQTDALTYMKQLKTLTPDMLLSYVQSLAALTEKGSFLTAGSSVRINESADRYDVIYDPFSVKK